MFALEAVVAVGVAILVAYVVAPRLRLAAPVVLLTLGALLGLIPELQSAALPPELVLLVLLPALLYWESLTTSLREIRRNVTSIALLSTALVVATAAAVATAAHGLGMPWGSAWVLGAAVAPTDATAIAALSRMLPPRQVTVLRTESLINDGTALVIFGVAVGVTVGERTLSVAGVTGLVLLSYGGGAAIGAGVAWVNIQLRRRLGDPLLGNLVMILAPFSAFLLSELIHASGVIAVVASGLIMSQAAPRVIPATHRTQALAFWPLLVFVINGALFVFVGIELQSIGRTIDGAQLGTALALVGIVSTVVIATRFAFLFASTWMHSVFARLRRTPSTHDGPAAQVVASLAGFRGAVSLAVALSVPEVLDSGDAFPWRELIVFVTGGTVLVTLVGQAIALPFAARAAARTEEPDVGDELADASVLAFRSALDELPALAAQVGASPKVVGWVTDAYETYLGDARAGRGDSDDAAKVQDRIQYVDLSLAAIAHRREVIIGLRDARVIDDTVLRRLQTALDLEELSLANPEPVE